jgi:Protein of unknown function (DUF3027)
VSAATRTRTRTPALDAVCAAAVDLALAAAEDVAGIGAVGPHLGAEADEERVVTHFFGCQEPAYRGWRWAVTVARASRSKLVTVDETVLLPGKEAVLPPEWVPWSERLRPGDLGVGDLLPTREDDERLAPGFTGADEGEPDPEDGSAVVAFELGLGRPRVLSPYGRELAAERWYSGERGPRAPIAEAAPAQCSTCGFLVQLGGPLGQTFGVCANEYSPSDGQVVAYDHGCGAHSEAAVMPATPDMAPPIVDEFSYEPVAVRPPQHSPGSVEVGEAGAEGEEGDAAEDLGHS